MTSANDASGGAAEGGSESTRTDAAAWRAAAKASLPAGLTLESLAHLTHEGLRIQPLYFERPVGSECLPPTQPHRVTDWDNRLQLIGDTDAELNAHALRGLDGGVTSLEIPTAPGQHVSGDQLPCSVPAVLENVDTGRVAISLAAGGDTLQRVGAVLRCWENASTKHAIDIRGELGMDPYGQLLLRGGDRYDFELELQRAGNVAMEVGQRFPGVSTITCNTVTQHAAGAGAILELMAAVGAAEHCLHVLLEAGVAREHVATQIVFQLAVDARFLVNVVKLRALRRLWQHALAQRDLPGQPLRLIAETSPRYQSRREPWMNHLRHVAAAMAAAAGGADTLIVHPHNRVDGEWLDEQPHLGERMARNIVPIIEHEARLLAVADPLAGSYAVESLTEQLCTAVWTGLGELQHQGGLLAAIVSGDWQQRIRRQHHAEMQRLANGDAVLIGVNRFTDDGANPPYESARQPGCTARTLSEQRVCSAFGA